MKKILFTILVIFITCSMFAEGQTEGKNMSSPGNEFLNWGDGISEVGNYRNLSVQKVQELFPGGFIAYEGWFTNYDDVNHIHTGDLYVVKLTHKNIGPVLLICPDVDQYFFMEDYINHSFFIRVEKQYFNKRDFFQPKELEPERSY